MRYYLIAVNGNLVYACTDSARFSREAAKYASVANATFLPPTGN